MTGWIMVDGKWYYMNQVVQAATWVLGSDGKWAFAGNTAAVPFGAMLADTLLLTDTGLTRQDSGSSKPLLIRYQLI